MLETGKMTSPSGNVGQWENKQCITVLNDMKEKDGRPRESITRGLDVF
jgi:hypothetical protein